MDIEAPSTHSNTPAGKWDTGGAVAVVSGLILLPIEPLSGASMLSSGLLAMYKGQVDRQLRSIEGTLDGVNETEERLRHAEGQVARLQGVVGEKDVLERRNTLLTAAAVTAAAVAVGSWYYMRRRTRAKSEMKVGADTIGVFSRLPETYHPRVADDADSHCICCMENIPDTLLRPCRHVSLCLACVRRLHSASCPSCRCAFDGVEYVFVA